MDDDFLQEVHSSLKENWILNSTIEGNIDLSSDGQAYGYQIYHESLIILY